VKAEFMPELIGWHDEGAAVLVIEDLGEAFWPPPWTDERIGGVLAALERVRATPAPHDLPLLDDLRDRLDGWPTIADDPVPFLSTGVCSSVWLDAALPRLREASGSCDLGGGELLHLDVRSDNLCFRDDVVKLVDWNLACVGNGLLDLVAWLPSLRLEAGPEPWEVVADSGGLASLIAGFFAARAGLPPPPTAPTVREFQRRQAVVALPWAARELGLPPPTLSA
jgi:hypothetical protein